jgi:hypothetical protein
MGKDGVDRALIDKFTGLLFLEESTAREPRAFANAEGHDLAT